MVKAINQLVGAPVESQVLLECLVEVFPKPLNGWYRGKITNKIKKQKINSILGHLFDEVWLTDEKNGVKRMKVTKCA